ncbi:polymer biosynthesis protein, WecB/TagA/CpsF family [Rhizobium sp. RU20A]|uniref:WecB/TagA/CpsF family glycosyltransferase n=1 Tax=Rhizobium sp. RU20A TaxID=1907412 RepID=UPI00095656FA|nr:WecB/TagA/CpsF family glycosyltransferase [Rhizobium sp. RU20A]SIQ40080.1 polymer biosynthesis protein, WecB/TagA/CpsF family [Rhizobium sp. RU20A]
MILDGFNLTNIGGMNITTLSRKGITKALVEDCLARNAETDGSKPKVLFDVNGQGLSLYHTNASFRSAMQQADMIHADGGFLVTLSKFFKGPAIEERSATTDLIHDIAAECVAKGLSFYLLGGEEELNRDCAIILQKMYPSLRIVGRRNGYFTAAEEADVVADINRANPDFLWVGMGKPREQTISIRWKTMVNARWIVTCGGCYNFITGGYTRAPLWMQNANLEFVYRAATNPRTHLWRYLVTSPHALWIALTVRDKNNSRNDFSK